MTQSLPPSGDQGVPAEFEVEIQAEVDRRVNALVSYAEQRYAAIPHRVAERLRELRIDWSEFRVTLGTDDHTAADGGGT